MFIAFLDFSLCVLKDVCLVIIANAIMAFYFDRELSFKKGDYIVVKRQIDRNWIEGEINGNIGIFPANHVEVCKI